MVFGLKKSLPTSLPTSLPGATAGGEDPEEVYAEFEALRAKVQSAKDRIYAALKPALPEVNLRFPRLDRAALADPTPGLGYEPLQEVATSSAGDVLDREPTEETANNKREMMLVAATEAPEPVYGGLPTPKVSEHMAGVRQAALCALTSLAFASGIALVVPGGGLVGPIMSAAQAVLINVGGLARTWHRRCAGYWGAIASQRQDLVNELLQLLEGVRKQVQALAAELEAAIDGLIEEQRPNLEKMAKHESTIKAVAPDFEVPDPQDLKKPLTVISGFVDTFVEDARVSLPLKLEEQLQSTFLGKLASDRRLFDQCAIQVPVALMLAVNLAIAVAQVLAVAGSAAPTRTAQNANARLLSSNTTEIGQMDTSPSAADWSQRLLPVMTPVVVQIVLTAAQLGIAMALSAAPRVCDLVNALIEGGETHVNLLINAKVQEVADKIFAAAFADVEKKADDFFPKLGEALGQLQPILEKAAKAAALAKGKGF